jgi:hypothetical protein
MELPDAKTLMTDSKFRSTNLIISLLDRNVMDCCRFAPKYLIWLEEEPFPKDVVVVLHKIQAVVFCFTSLKNDWANYFVMDKTALDHHRKKLFEVACSVKVEKFGKPWAGVVVFGCPIYLA